MIHLMMLEPLEERYTAQWKRWIPMAMNTCGYDFTTVYGQQLTSKIETGSVLDAHGTSYFKSTQMAELIKKIYHGEVKDGDIVWFADLWYPGLEHLAYIRDLTGIKFKISGVLHAGSWDKDDFINRTGIHQWCKGFEQTMFDIADEIHVGTHFHKNMILSQGWCEEGKIKVTGLFFDAQEVHQYSSGIAKDPNLVVFCQRLDPEKRPELFKKLEEEMQLLRPELKFVVTRHLNLSKEEYYKYLATATYAVSFDGQETFGYTVLECMALGVTPLVANSKAYKETVPAKFRWDTFADLEQMLLETRPEAPGPLLGHSSLYTPSVVASRMFT